MLLIFLFLFAFLFIAYANGVNEPHFGSRTSWAMGNVIGGGSATPYAYLQSKNVAQYANRTSVQGNELPYPYARYYTSENELIDRFMKVRVYKFGSVDKPYTIRNIRDMKRYECLYLKNFFKHNRPSYKIFLIEDREMNNISEYFTDECLVKAKRYDHEMNQLEYWNAHKHELREKAIKQYGSDAPANLVLALYSEHYGITTFKPTLVTNIIDELFADRTKVKMLDISAGWGDRLIGAMCANVHSYRGVDPNTCLHPKYKEIEQFFRKYSDTIVDMICSPFETANITDDKYNLILTCPPYFNLEIYSDEPTQSSHYGQLDSWYNNFLITSLAKAWQQLEYGGYMTIIINDIKGEPGYVKRMIDDVNSWKDTLYYGVISYNTQSPQPIWIWQKHIYDINPVVPVMCYTRNGLAEEGSSGCYMVVRGDMLPGGIKQLGGEFIKDIKEKEIVYASPTSGLAQCALAFACKAYGKKAIVLLGQINHPNSIKARMLGATLVEISKSPLKELQAHAAAMKDVYVTPFGFNADAFKVALKRKLTEQMNKYIEMQPLSIWVVAGSGILYSILREIFSNDATEFHIVQVGRKIWPDQLDGRTKLYIAPEPFNMDAKEQPPYPTVANYDAKLWQFLIRSPPTNLPILVWNVGTDEYNL